VVWLRMHTITEESILEVVFPVVYISCTSEWVVAHSKSCRATHFYPRLSFCIWSRTCIRVICRDSPFSYNSPFAWGVKLVCESFAMTCLLAVTHLFTWVGPMWLIPVTSTCLHVYYVHAWYLVMPYNNGHLHLHEFFRA